MTENRMATIPSLREIGKLSRDKLLDRLGSLGSVGRTEVEAEDAGHVIQEAAVDERGRENEWDS